MFLRLIGLFLIGMLIPFQSLAQSEEERRAGFYEQQKFNKKFDQDREAGLKDYLREQTEWEEQRKKDIQADKKRKKQVVPNEDSPEYKADRKAKYEDYEEYESNRKAYVKEKKSHAAKSIKEQAKRDEWALEEYGLDKERPRFDIAKRNFNGGKSSTKPSGSSGGAPSGGNSPSPSFPPPPPFDDFSDGYVPPSFPPPEPFEPPPEGFPPPPPIPFPGEQGSDFEGGYFPPPPPPMPAPMDGDSF